MPPGTSQLTHIAHEGVHLEFTLPDGIEIEALIQYVDVWRTCCVGIGDEKPHKVLMAERIRHLCTRKSTQVLAAAKAGNAADLVDLGSRLYTGCSMRQGTIEAGFYWQGVEDLGSNAPPFQRACALACLARLELDRVPTAPADVFALWRACELAEECAALGHMPPVVIQAGKAAEDAGWRPLIEPTQTMMHNVASDPELFAAFGQLTSLWEVLDQHKEQCLGKELKLAEKHARKLNAYVCAAEGCGIEATSKSSLMRCAGPCAADDKPSYCSKDCQRRDWRHHKQVCKGRKSTEVEEESLVSPCSAASSSSTAATVGGELAIRETDEEAMFRNDGKEYWVDIPDSHQPGKTIRTSSKSLSPAMMRTMRERAGKLGVPIEDLFTR